MTRLFTFLLCLCTTLSLALPAAAQDFSDTQKQAIDAQIERYILDNPDIVVRALQALQEREEAQKLQASKDFIAANADAIYNDGYSYVGGNPEGSLTLVEFLDYQCGFCKRAHPVVTQFLEDNDDIRYVIKEFPVLGEASDLAAKAALAAVDLDEGAHYQAFHDSLMTHEGRLDEATIMTLAKDAGLDKKALKQAMQDPQTEANIKKTYDLAKKLQIAGTPYFVFGDQIIRGVPDPKVLNAIIAEQKQDQS